MKKILLADDHAIIRTGLKNFLSREFSNFQFDETADGNSTLHSILNSFYDLIILDVSMPGTDSFTIVEKAIENNPSSKILIFTMNGERMYAHKFLQLGVKGYIRKDDPSDEIKQAVLTLLDNRRYLSKWIREGLADEVSQKKQSNPFMLLSPRQLEIARLLMSGNSLSEICLLLGLKPSTIGTQKRRIFEKLKVSNLIELHNSTRLYPGILSLASGAWVITVFLR